MSDRKPNGRVHRLHMQARRWLVRHDPDGADYWRSLPTLRADFIGAVRDNINTFGPTGDEDALPAALASHLAARLGVGG